MLTIGAMPILLKIVGKLDIKPITEKLKNLDIFEEPKDGENALAQLSNEKIGVLAFEILGEITPQLGKIADDLPAFVAAYKDITVEEAKKLDAATVISEMLFDSGLKNFFKVALRQRAGQGH